MDANSSNSETSKSSTVTNVGGNIERKEFGKLRALLFPIYSHEFKKLIPLSLIFLAVSMTYTMLRSLKDVYVYRYMSSASIYILKIFVIPSIVIFTFLYTLSASKVESHNRFNVVFGYFLSFILLFSLVLLPGLDYLNLGFITDSLSSSFPKLIPLWNIIKFWPISLLYIHAEAYGTMALGVAFWTFANSIFSSAQAKRMYGFLSSGAAVGALLSGIVMLKFSKETSLLFVVANGSLVFILLLYNYLIGRIHKDPAAYEVETENSGKSKKKKVKLGFIESIKKLASSRYLCFMAMIVLGYNMFIALLESIWKGRVDMYKKDVVRDFLTSKGYEVSDVMSDPSLSELKKLAGDAGTTATSEIYAWQSICTGIFSLFLIFFVASSMSKKSWKVKALFTPVIALSLSSIFYIFYKKMNILTPLADSFDIPLLLTFILFGMGILVSIKSSKYIFFDTSKEQAYIPLDEDEKVNGKAAIDAIGSRLGKGMSSIIISVLSTIYGGLPNISGITFIIIFFVIGFWLLAVVSLNPLYERKLIEKEKEKEDANVEANNSSNTTDNNK